MGRFINPLDKNWYNPDWLRSSDGADEADDEPAPNYKCQRCGKCEHIDDYQSGAVAWCNWCEKITHFEPLNKF